MHAARFAAPFLTVAILGGCSAQDSTAPTKHVVSPRFDLVDPASGPSASGHANFVNLFGEYGSRSFSARQKEDGSVAGNFVQHTTAVSGEKRVNKGDIDCLRLLAPNDAVLSGPVHEHINPAVIGLTQIFRVQDNGEGAEATDMVSNLIFREPSTGENCEDITPTVMFEVRSGNVQVRP